MLKSPYFALFQPYMIYGIEAWHETFKNATDRALVVQKRAVRAVNGLIYTDHTSQYFKSMALLRVNEQ